MSRVRILVSETNITKAGQVKHFQIKLSKHAFKIVGIETDVFAKSHLTKDGTIQDTTGGIPRATVNNNNTAGKLKLQSMEKENIFFSDWVKASVFYEEFKQPKAFEIHSGLKDIRGKTAPKKVDVPVESTIINAVYVDTIGKFHKQDISYTLKVFVWIETNDNQNGVTFEFLNNEKETTEK